jgi:hypothetical protein
MTDRDLTPEAPRTAAELCQQFELDGEARRHLREDQTPSDYFQRLVEHGLYPDAIRFAAHLLPKREAVWWACLCVWHVARGHPPDDQAAGALHAAVRWVREPSEANRRAAAAPAASAGLNTAAGCAAMAAFWSGGSMSAPDLPLVPPPPYLTAKTVAAAVQLAPAQGDPRQLAEHYRQFLLWAIDVDNGTNRWE